MINQDQLTEAWVQDISGKYNADPILVEKVIPAATQLFTPRWIVEYMVQNTVGKLWVLNHPNSKLKEHMPYYIESEVTVDDLLNIDKPEELKLLDQ